MAVDAFLKIDGIDGESADKAHEKWIEIDGFSWSANQPVSSASGTGARTAERVTISDVSITKIIDSSSPHLMLSCCNGKHFPNVKREICEASENKHRYLLVEMEDVILASYTPSGFKGGDKVGESVGLNFGKIKWEYTPLGQIGRASCRERG